jgi:diguanylate cyclase (GGDEF)-like protein
VDPSLNVKERVRADLVALLFQQVPQSALINAAVASILCTILWDVTPRAALVGWWVVVVSMSLLRTAVAFAFRRRKNDDDIRAWQHRFTATLVATGAVWGIGGWIVMPDDLEYELLVYGFLMAMVGGSIASYSAHMPSVIATSILVMLPATLDFAIEKSGLTRAMAIACVIYLAAAFRAAHALSKSLRRSYELTHELEIARVNAEREARTDELTRMRNRRAFHELGELAMAQAMRYGDPIALITLDIDRFKRVNDTYGHAVGDEVLRAVAGVILRTVRTSDIAARIGGEEFAVLLPRAAAGDAVAMAERLRAAMERTPVPHPRGDLRFTASFGVALPGPQADTLERLLAEADKALYAAKEGGRNRVVCQGAEPGPALTRAAS